MSHTSSAAGLGGTLAGLLARAPAVALLAQIVIPAHLPDYPTRLDTRWWPRGLRRPATRSDRPGGGVTGDRTGVGCPVGGDFDCGGARDE